jgi:hypothetical protein
VPELRHLPALPRVEDVAVLDPTTVRSPWDLAEAPVDHVVLLEPGDRSGPPTVAAVPGPMVLEALVRQAFPVAESKADLVRTLAAVTASSRGHRVTRGDPAATVSALRALIR